MLLIVDDGCMRMEFYNRSMTIVVSVREISNEVGGCLRSAHQSCENRNLPSSILSTLTRWLECRKIE